MEKALEEAQLKIQASVGYGGPRDDGDGEDGLVGVSEGDGSKHVRPPSPKRAARAEPDLDQAKEEFCATLHSYTRSFEELDKWFVDLGHGQNKLMRV